MAQFVEFVGNHWILSSLWVALLVAFIVHRNKTGAQAVGPQQAVMLINRADGVVLDIREKKEFDSGHIVDSIHMPAAKVAAGLAQLEKYRNRPLIVICKMGQHSADVCKQLKQAGFTQVVRLSGGMSEWKAQNLPLVQKEKVAKEKAPRKEPKKERARKKEPEQAQESENPESGA